MAHRRKKLGDWGEAVAADYLRENGYTILKRQWRCRWGEMDLIASLHDAIVFVEVKTRRSRAMGAPEQAITPRKSVKLRRVALAYLGEHELDVDWQIDLVAIELDQSNQLQRLDHIPNVVVSW